MTLIPCKQCGGSGQRATALSTSGHELERHERQGTKCDRCNGTGEEPKAELGTPEERTDLIEICEAAIVPENDWHDRDSYGAQVQVGRLWALLRAGCDFRIHRPGDLDRGGRSLTPVSDGRTIWVTTWAEGFAHFDYGGRRESDLHYLPHRARLMAAEGKDWY